jgi:NADPH-dependent 2,4-dienoyl-CoA reductase/sulfur reductase-like enzyme
VITQGEVTIAADWVVAGVGLDLNTRIWQDVGLKVEDGISVDTFLRTTDPSIYAAGDIAHFPSPSLGLALRVEHEDNAAAQGRLAGMNMAGAGRPYTHIPSFYSDLFDLGFEAVGRMDSSMEIFEDWKVPFREGVVYYLESGMVKGVLLWNVFNRVDEARKIIDSKKVFQDRGKLRGLLKEYAPA